MPAIVKHLAIVLAYLASAVAWIYALQGFWWALAFAAFHVAIGVLGRTWWYLLLPFSLGPLAVGTDTGDAGEGWAFALLLVAPIGACLVALGVGAAKVLVVLARA